MGCFPTFVDEVFRQISPTQSNKSNRVLELYTDSHALMGFPRLFILKDKKDNRYIAVFWHELAFESLLETMLHDVVDELIFGVKESNNFRSTMDISLYCSILQHLPSLKKLVLDIPQSYKEKQRKYGGKPLTQVKDVTIQATTDGRFQTLLQLFSSMFPNVNRLAHYFSGIWVEGIGEFQLILSQYSLEILTLDMTPVKTTMYDHLKKPLIDTDFVVIEVKILGGSKHYLYKVPLVNLSSITRIQSHDLEGCIHGEDYLRVCISIKHLRYLELCMCTNYKRDEDYLRHANSKQIVRNCIYF